MQFDHSSTRLSDVVKLMLTTESSDAHAVAASEDLAGILRIAKVTT